MAKYDHNDFSQSLEDWEVAVFRHASQFVAIHHLGRIPGGSPLWERQEFSRSQLRQAIEAAKQPTANRKPRLLYAITAGGRQIVLSATDHDKWLAADRALAADVSLS